MNLRTRTLAVFDASWENVSAAIINRVLALQLRAFDLKLCTADGRSCVKLVSEGNALVSSRAPFGFTIHAYSELDHAVGRASFLLLTPDSADVARRQRDIVVMEKYSGGLPEGTIESLAELCAAMRQLVTASKVLDVLDGTAANCWLVNARPPVSAICHLAAERGRRAVGVVGPASESGYGEAVVDFVAGMRYELPFVTDGLVVQNANHVNDIPPTAFLRGKWRVANAAIAPTTPLPSQSLDALTRSARLDALLVQTAVLQAPSALREFLALWIQEGDPAASWRPLRVGIKANRAYFNQLADTIGEAWA